MPDLVTLAGPMTDRILCWSAETILVGSALAAVAALACRTSGRRLSLGPAARHALWLVVLIRLMAPPLVHWPWSLPIPGAMAATASDPAREFAARLRPLRDVDGEWESPGEAGAVLDAARSRIEPPPVRDPGPSKWSILSSIVKRLMPWVAATWLAGSIALGLGQVRRIDRFRRRVRGAAPAPGWLVDEAERVGGRLAVRVPEIRVLPGLGTPLLWCLGRPVMLVPDDLLRSLDRGRWPAILAHELAHLRRLDPWVRRLELLAGLVWWWNPLFWVTRRRLDFEAELACDAWVLWALPDDRLTYAESLIQISSSKSPAATPAPSLGVAGSARSFERRLTMILGDRVACRVPAPGLLGAALLTLLALPSWTLAESARDDDGKDAAVAATRTATADTLIVDYDSDLAVVVRDDDLAVVVRDDDDDDDKDGAKAKEKAEKLKAIAKEKAKAAKEKTKAAKNKAEAKKEFRVEMRLDDKDFGPEFEKKMEAFGKEMEAKFGPGSEFEKKMKAMGKEMEFKFGPGSKFELEMKNLGEEMAKEFGPGSDFEKKMKSLEGLKGKAKLDAEQKIRDEAKVQEKRTAEVRAKAEERAREVRARAEERTKETRARADRARAEAATTRKARRIEALEAQIKKMTEELKRLKAQDEGDEDEKG
jgi:beta-lactamase regulating signal transducer with metallopeptidase domain